MYMYIRYFYFSIQCRCFFARLFPVSKLTFKNKNIVQFIQSNLLSEHPFGIILRGGFPTTRKFSLWVLRGVVKSASPKIRPWRLGRVISTHRSPGSNEVGLIICEICTYLPTEIRSVITTRYGRRQICQKKKNKTKDKDPESNQDLSGELSRPGIYRF